MSKLSDLYKRLSNFMREAYSTTALDEYGKPIRLADGTTATITSTPGQDVTQVLLGTTIPLGIASVGPLATATGFAGGMATGAVGSYAGLKVSLKLGADEDTLKMVSDLTGFVASLPGAGIGTRIPLNYKFYFPKGRLYSGIPIPEVRPKWQLQELPGMQIKSLIKGSPLEKQLSKTGTIAINQLEAYLRRNDVSAIDKELIGRFLLNHQGERVIDYNTLRSEVLNMIPKYERIPLTGYEKYGMDRIGISTEYNTSLYDSMAYSYINDYKNQNYSNIPLDVINVLEKFRIGDPPSNLIGPDGRRIRFRKSEKHFINKKSGEGFTERQLKNLIANNIAENDPYQSIAKPNTFTFESPGIKGNTKHYLDNPIGHSRTYTTTDEPNVLHVMESLSDWALNATRKYEDLFDAYLAVFERLGLEKIDPLNNTYEPFTRPDMIEWTKSLPEDMLIEGIPQKELMRYYNEVQNEIRSHPYLNPINNHLIKNYLPRQLQENLRFAAENGLTKMRYPTSETAAKIEGYGKTIPNSVRIELTRRNNNAQALFENGKITYPQYDLLVREAAIWANQLPLEYEQAHQTILKKYSDFPNQFRKLFGKQSEVRTVTDPKNNTWFEVDVPESYLNGTAEMIFKKGGKLYKQYFK